MLYEAALDMVDADDPRRIDLLLDRADVWTRSLRFDEARADLEEAHPLVEEGHDPSRLVGWELAASELAQWSDDIISARAHAQEAHDVARAAGDELLVAASQRRIGVVQLFGGDHAGAEESITASLAVYELAGDVTGTAWARQNLAWIAFMEGHMAEAEVRLSAASEAFAATGDRAGQAWSSGLLAYVRIYDGRFAEADELARRTLADAADAGDAWGQGMMHVALATSALWTGRIDEALDHTAEALTVFPGGADSTGPSQAAAVRGRALVRRGHVAEGFAAMHAAAEANPIGPPHELVHTSIAAAAASVGDTDRAVSNFGDLVDFDPDLIGESERTVATALTRLQLGEFDAAFDLLHAIPTPGERRGSTWGWAVLAIAAAGLGKDIDPWVDTVEASSRATYADRVLARTAVACAAARSSDEAGARVALTRAAEAIPSGGDRLHPAIIQAARASCLTSTGSAEAPEAAARAEAKFAEFGLDVRGWRTAFDIAAGVQPD